ncbi:hypothetical protein [Phenylobacterium sp.]|uniref:hypothetical protein n=1 Tax=Phenylobacterium sp. TaxID=1871053 RepID=UPI00301C2FBD
MAKIPTPDERAPTLEAADRALESKSQLEKPRPYLGMSSLAEPCSRKLFYRFRWAGREIFDALTLKRFEDGFRTEDLVIQRLKMAPGVTVIDRDPATGRQIAYSDVDGHVRGHADGLIDGILQAPKTRHVLEIKATALKKFNELQRIIRDYGQKAALRKWNPIYYGQGMLYAFYEGLTRHYTVVSTPGGREWLGVRTDADTSIALELKAKAERIVRANTPPVRLSETPDQFECRFCSFANICHRQQPPERNCRTCLHAAPVWRGQWRCERWDKILSEDAQREGCPAHLYLPGFVAGEVDDVGESWVKYRMHDGSTFVDSETG